VFCRSEAEQAERDKIAAQATSYHTACARKRSYLTCADRIDAALAAFHSPPVSAPEEDKP